MTTQGKRLYPFVPSGPNFQESLKFFHELGFVKLWENENDGLAALRFGEAQFLLSNIDIQEWQSNQIIVYEVDDLEAYYLELQAKDIPTKFPGRKIGPPTDYPWGREVQFIDPGGVCWHVRQYEGN